MATAVREIRKVLGGLELWDVAGAIGPVSYDTGGSKKPAPGRTRQRMDAVRGSEAASWSRHRRPALVGRCPEGPRQIHRTPAGPAAHSRSGVGPSPPTWKKPDAPVIGGSAGDDAFLNSLPATAARGVRDGPCDSSRTQVGFPSPAARRNDEPRADSVASPGTGGCPGRGAAHRGRRASASSCRAGVPHCWHKGATPIAATVPAAGQRAEPRPEVAAPVVGNAGQRSPSGTGLCPTGL